MSQTTPEPEPYHAPQYRNQQSRPERQEIFERWAEQSQKILVNWLYELGGWIFGGFIVTALMLIQVLISLGTTDHATLISSIAIAVALPFNIAGLSLVRYFKDLNQAATEAQRFLTQNQTANEETIILGARKEAFTPAKKKLLDTSVTVAIGFSAFSTLISISAALWHISWVVTLVFLISGILSLLLLFRVLLYQR
jgi:hypothetical protein